ncbi:MAG: YmdB family metallophosphoesterase [Elusimicrobia bacterium]|nr:YmdB family metallophosphoesterase [Elusimicrobiota bacterium]
MRVLFVGDVFGRPGREIISRVLPALIKEREIDFVIINGENSAGGKGITPKTCEDFFSAGADVITGGDHIWDRKEILEIINDSRILRPANLPEGSPGKGIGVYSKEEKKIQVVSLMGRTFIERPLDCPFQTAGRLHFDIPTIVDFHAEATSEKVAMKWFLAGKASAVLGTHTHIPTDDLEICDGTAYITDCGMTGAYDSVIGVEKNVILKRFLTGFPARHETAKKDVRFYGIFLEIKGIKTVNAEKIKIV